MIGLVKKTKEGHGYGHENAPQGAKENYTCQCDQRPAEFSFADGSDLPKLNRTRQPRHGGDDYRC